MEGNYLILPSKFAVAAKVFLIRICLKHFDLNWTRQSSNFVVKMVNGLAKVNQVPSYS